MCRRFVLNLSQDYLGLSAPFSPLEGGRMSNRVEKGKGGTVKGQGTVEGETEEEKREIDKSKMRER